VDADAAEEGEAVDVAEVDFAAEEEEGAEEEEEEDGTGEVGVVHDVLVDAREGVEDGEGFELDVREVYAEFFLGLLSAYWFCV